MIIITIGAYTGDDMPGVDGRFVETLNDKVAERWPGLEFSVVVKDGVVTTVESDGSDDPATPDPDPDEVYRFVMNAWVDLVFEEAGREPPEEA